MLPDAAAPWAARLARVRNELETAGLDAFLVSHPPNIRYLTSFSGSAGLLVVHDSRAALIVDSRYGVAARAAVTASRTPDPIEVIVAATALDEAAAERLRYSGARRIGIEGQWMSVARFNRLSAALAPVALSPAGTADSGPSLVTTDRVVERGRIIKDAGEIATLREGGRRLALVAARMPAFVRAGRTELEVAADIDALIREVGFERPAFETIVASGPNGALPHARPGRRALARGDGVVLDFGGVYDGYSVDLTRTVELGTATLEWRRLAAAVADAHRAALAAVHPGVAASSVDAAARDVLTAHGFGAAFGHATGHGLGLEVHEEPRIGRRQNGQMEYSLEPGMVFTIEPGAYVEGVGGARLEDDVVVTETGVDVLTRE